MKSLYMIKVSIRAAKKKKIVIKTTLIQSNSVTTWIFDAFNANSNKGPVYNTLPNNNDILSSHSLSLFLTLAQYRNKGTRFNTNVRTLYIPTRQAFFPSCFQSLAHVHPWLQFSLPLSLLFCFAKYLHLFSALPYKRDNVNCNTHTHTYTHYIFVSKEEPESIAPSQLTFWCNNGIRVSSAWRNLPRTIQSHAALGPYTRICPEI